MDNGILHEKRLKKILPFPFSVNTASSNNQCSLPDEKNQAHTGQTTSNPKPGI